MTYIPHEKQLDKELGKLAEREMEKMDKDPTLKREIMEEILKPISICCLECGKKYDTKHKTCYGVWTDDCDICGSKNVDCASAGHDFGIYNERTEKVLDHIEDLIV